jgi:cell wall-associated NlpC family hydrolase
MSCRILLLIALFAATPLATIAQSSKSKRDSDESPTEAKQSPSPSKKKKTGTKRSPTPEPDEASPTPKASPKKSASPRASASPKKKVSPRPSATPSASPSASPTATPAPPTEKPDATPAPSAPDPRTTTIPATQLRDFEKEPEGVRKLIQTGLDLASRGLRYTYGSSDPANGGMDCSGFIYYVLQQNGFAEAPRDSSGLYSWVRKAGTFRAVIGRTHKSFEFDELQPGDLLFWTGTYAVERDPPVSHTMIYLGRDKKTGKPLMVGSSDGRTYLDEKQSGVSVFDFKMPRAGDGEKRTPVFIGYARIPGLRED